MSARTWALLRRDMEADQAFRERAKTAPLVMRDVESRTSLSVAVYRPSDAHGKPSYGTATPCESLEAAMAAARADLMMGYGRLRESSRVYVIETQTRVREVCLGD